MAFKDIHKLKKIVEIQKEFIEIDYLVIGKDVYSVAIYRELVNKYGSDKVRLLSEDTINASDIYLKGPSTLRGDANKEVVKNLFPSIESIAVESNSIFYKDLAWKSFGGRSKPETLKFDEEFYVNSRMNISEMDIFDWITTEENFYEELNQNAYKVKVKNINYNDEKFTVECINGTEFKTNKLYCGKSPSYFLKHYSELSHLSNNFVQFCESTTSVSALFVKYVFDKPLSDLKETMFIPLSYTHEHGHYVGEFKTANGLQSAEFLHYVDENHASEEDISRIIRGLKKGFEKIFENFGKINFREFIALEDEIACLKIDDNSFNESLTSDKNMLNHLTFIGENAPLHLTWHDTYTFEYSDKSVSHMARALFVHKEILKNI
jgi:hypothetical protein